MTPQIYQLAQKIVYFLRRQINTIQIKVISPLIDIAPKSRAFFRKKMIRRWLNCGEVRFMLDVVGQEEKFLTSLPTKYLINANGLFSKLGELQKERIKMTLDLSKKTVAVYFPSGAYREHAGNITNRLGSKGYNVLFFIGTVCNDQYEKQQKPAYYGNNGIMEDLDFIDVLIETSPTPDRPRKARKIFFVHDIYDSPYSDAVNMDAFLRYMLKCDYLFLPSNCLLERYKQLISSVRGESSKRVGLIPGGYIKLDRNLEYFDKHKQDTKTIIYAPTITNVRMGGMGDVTSIEHGDKIVEAVLNHFSNYNLIFRPHPHALHTAVVQNIVKKHSSHPRFMLDDNPSFYMDNYSKSALMITDMSGTAYTYCFTTLRPVIFFSHNDNKAKKRWKGIKYLEDRSKVGYIANDIDEMTDKIRLLLAAKNEFSSKIKKLRDSQVYNIGKAEDYFLDNFEYIIKDKKHPDWVYV